MLNSDFDFAFNEFTNLDSQIQFYAPLSAVSTAFNSGYIKWTINGLGESYGFWFKLKSNQQPFIVKTMANVNESNKTEPIEWLIDASNIFNAQDVFTGLKLDPKIITWKKGN